VDLERNAAIDPFPQNTNRQTAAEDITRDWTTWWGMVGMKNSWFIFFLENSSAKNWSFFEVVNLSSQFWKWITLLVSFGSG